LQVLKERQCSWKHDDKAIISVHDIEEPRNWRNRRHWNTAIHLTFALVVCLLILAFTVHYIKYNKPIQICLHQHDGSNGYIHLNKVILNEINLQINPW